MKLITADHTNMYSECFVHEYTIILSMMWADRYIITLSEFLEGDKSFYSALETLKRQMISMTSGILLNPTSCDRLPPTDRIDPRVLHFTLVFQGHENVGFSILVLSFFNSFIFRENMKVALWRVFVDKILC